MEWDDANLLIYIIRSYMNLLEFMTIVPYICNYAVSAKICFTRKTKTVTRNKLIILILHKQSYHTLS